MYEYPFSWRKAATIIKQYLTLTLMSEMKQNIMQGLAGHSFYSIRQYLFVSSAVDARCKHFTEMCKVVNIFLSICLGAHLDAQKNRLGLLGTHNIYFG